MSSNLIYPATITELKTACSKHLEGRGSADELQRAVQKAEMVVVAIEESDIREFLTNLEGRFELIKFTANDDEQLAETQKIAKQALNWLVKREQEGLDEAYPGERTPLIKATKP